MPNPRLIVLAFAGLLTGLLPGMGHAQLLGNDAQAQDCAAAVGGDVTDSSVKVICGMPTGEVVALVQALNSPDPAAKAEALELLRARLPGDTRFRLEAIARFFEILGEERVDSEKLADTFARIAEDHLRLRERLRAFESDDPEVQALREQAAEALERADHDAAREHLEAARQTVRAKREALRAALVEQTREEARLVAEQGDVERARLAVAAAAALYDEATSLVAPLDADAAGAHLRQAADAWYEHGRDKGDNAALETSIARWRSLLEQTARDRVPLDWAGTQNNLGSALSTLGARESGTARLEQAVAAYRAALEEYTRERVPARLGQDPEQPRHRALDPRRARERHRTPRGGRRRLPRRPRGMDPRARARSTGP